ncbi:MAG TPA: PfkB family carbohydrate kinase [Phycisphaerae bacterium]|nr:PfkB family carbohydrate kinase [Phycisphaerae bacterium]
MDRRRLEQLLADVARVRVAVIGDFCLDAYWLYDPSGSEISLETGKPTHAVRRHRYGLGGAGNVVSNLIDLGVAQVLAFGVVGDDLFGREMARLLSTTGTDVAGLVTQADDWDTPVYGKPHEGDEEDRRIDFGAFNALSRASQDELLARLVAALPQLQCVVVNQQLGRGLWVDEMIERFIDMVARWPQMLFVVDSRNRAERFGHVVLKLNEIEAARICGQPVEPDAVVPAEQAQGFARQIFDRTSRPVFITRGARGLVAFDDSSVHIEPGIQILHKADPVGAGDTAVAAIAASLAAGASYVEAARLANFAATVTVQKVQQTGTATPDEILRVGADPDYVYHPELADDPRRARHQPDTEIELVTERLAPHRITHAVFDHDGTISVLRQGWETVMEPMMVQAILGPAYMTANEAVYHRVVARVRDYIDKSTGLQTILQMEALAEMVREFGHVPDEHVLDAHGYKKIYNDALMELVRDRLAKLHKGELEVRDLTIRGAVTMLQLLSERGVTLYLASGTDRQDLIAEAEALGYAGLFEDRIYGAVGDVSKYSKKIVVDRILQEHRLAGSELACFGDGPVELREVRKRGGLAIGVASDEVRRYGLDLRKRSRLIRAGADLIVPDFSQAPILLGLLFDSPA